MSSSFHTLEEGMRIILYLLFLQEPFAFPTSCSLQLHWRWARRGPKNSARCLRRPGLGLTSPWRARLQTEGGVGGEGCVSFPEPLHPSPSLQTSQYWEGEGVARAYLRASPAQSLSLSLVSPGVAASASGFLTLFPLFLEILHPCLQMKARLFCSEHLLISIKMKREEGGRH